MAWYEPEATHARLVERRHGKALEHHRRLVRLHALGRNVTASEHAAVARLAEQLVDNDPVVVLSADDARALATLLYRLVQLRKALRHHLPERIPESPEDLAEQRQKKPWKKPRKKPAT